MENKIIIDGRAMDILPGETVRSAALRAGIPVPGLCDPAPGGCTSCRLCLAEVSGAGIRTTCDLPAAPGMVVSTRGPEVRRAREISLDHLLYEHRGDCEAPCRQGCPARLDIQGMMEALQEGQQTRAAAMALQALVFPGILGEICPAPCEVRCRRSKLDSPLAIRRLHGIHVGQVRGLSMQPEDPRLGEIAVLGAGPAGIAAARYLRDRGFSVVLGDRETLPGGGLRKAWSGRRLPEELLVRELEQALRGITFLPGISGPESLLDGRPGCRGLILATGTESPDLPAGLPSAAAKSTKAHAAVSALREGRAAAASLIHLLGLTEEHELGEDVPASFHSTFGPQREGDLSFWVANSRTPIGNPDQRNVGKRAPGAGEAGNQEAGDPGTGEAYRCLSCGCADSSSCRLRRAGEVLRPGFRHSTPNTRASLTREIWGSLAWEIHKCVRCGLCVEAGRKGGLEGPWFENRGWRTALTFPPGAAFPSPEGARTLTAVCPTCALTVVRDSEGLPGVPAEMEVSLP